MSKPLTLNNLLKICIDEYKKGNGDKVVMLSNDDEGNGFHYLFFGFTNAKDLLEEDDTVEDDFDEKVAPIDNTIILG